MGCFGGLKVFFKDKGQRTDKDVVKSTKKKWTKSSKSKKLDEFKQGEDGIAFVVNIDSRPGTALPCTSRPTSRASILKVRSCIGSPDQELITQRRDMLLRERTEKLKAEYGKKREACLKRKTDLDYAFRAASSAKVQRKSMAHDDVLRRQAEIRAASRICDRTAMSPQISPEVYQNGLAADLEVDMLYNT